MNEDFVDFLIHFCTQLPTFTRCHAKKYTLLYANHQAAQIVTSFYSFEMKLFIIVATPNWEDRQISVISLNSDFIHIFRSSINHGIHIDLETFDFPFACFGN